MNEFNVGDRVYFLNGHPTFAIIAGDTATITKIVTGFTDYKDHRLYNLVMDNPVTSRGGMWCGAVLAYPDEIKLIISKITIFPRKHIHRTMIPFGNFESLWKEVVG